ncbi:MAG TPA: AEC family transporter [Geminicoccaceae bacterium]|nr:AEC family transporter [Geminicoccus sp.]HMU49578.1 AEC family transporter [Geminicoccaceae bacterium]
MSASQSVLAVAPVAILIAFGHLLARVRFVAEPGWAAMERLLYFVCFPALLFVELAKADFTGQPVLSFGGTVLAAQLAVAAIVWRLRRPLRMPGPSYTSVMQCVVRWNSYVALAMAPMLFGRQAAPLAALAVAIMVPVANLVSVAALARHGSGGAPGLLPTLKALSSNPLILACIAGILVHVAGTGLPVLVAEPLSVLGRATLALGLLAVGAALRPAAMLTRPMWMVVAAGCKLLAKPLLALAIGLAAGLDRTALGVAVLVCAVPTSTTSYILARLLGGDAELMTGLITTTTIMAVLTMPLVLAMVR